MPVNFSFEDFNAIAGGKYNAGQIDYVQKNNEAKLVKVNNHVFKTGENNHVIDKEHVLEIKNAFLNSLSGRVNEDVIREIAEKIGMGDVDGTKGPIDVDKTVRHRYEPLQRQQVREIIDKYVLAQDKAPQVSKSIVERRNAVNTVLDARSVNMDANLNDLLDILTMNMSLDAVLTRHQTGNTELQGYERDALTSSFASHISTLFKAAVTLLPENAPSSKTISIFGQNVELICKRGQEGEAPAFSVRISGANSASFTVNLGVSMDNMVKFLQTEIVKNKNDVFTAGFSGSLLDTVYSKDIMGGIRTSDTTSDTRQFAAQIISKRMTGNSIESIINSKVRTDHLVMIAKELLEQKDVRWNFEDFTNYHNELKHKIGGLDEETIALLSLVSHIPIENPDGSQVNLTISSDMLNKEGPQEGINRPFVNDIDEVAGRELPDKLVQHLNSNNSASSPENIRDFIADMMFSSETLMSDVNMELPGAHFRHFIMSNRNMDAFRAIMQDSSVLDTAVAPTLLPAAKQCFEAMANVIKSAYQEKYGVSLAEDGNTQDFKLKFAKLINEMDGNVLSQCDNYILQFANNGTEQIQSFINDVFNLGGDQDGVQDNDFISKPYSGKNVGDIKQIVHDKNLNDLLDDSSRDAVPGQVGLFKVGLRNYFKSMTVNDKRSLLASSLRFAETYDFSNVKDEHQNSVKQFKTAKFCGAILKGTGPILQKMMQGLPRTMMGGFADALEDMKSNLPQINRKIVQAHFAKILKDNPDIQSITLKKSLGAATVGEALLCEVTYKDGEKTEKKDIVIKIMRHDAVERTKREAKIFEAAAKKLGVGMEKTWEGQYKKILEELDFNNEAENVKQGVKAYNKLPSTSFLPEYPNTNRPQSVQLFDKIKVRSNVLALELARGTCMDKHIKEMREDLNAKLRSIFESDPATGQILWENGKPVLRSDFKFLQLMTIRSQTQMIAMDMNIMQQAMMATASIWFEEAILGDGMYHGDMHAGNMMCNGGNVKIIDFGNVTRLSKRPDGVDERKCILKMILGSMMRIPGIFLEGFKTLLSKEGAEEYNKNADKVNAILTEVMAKGQFSYDMCYRLQAAVNELQKLELEMPPQINGFIQSMTRLQNTLADVNTLLSQYNLIFEDIFNGNMLKPGEQVKKHELDIIGDIIEEFHKPEAHELYSDVNDDDYDDEDEDVEITKYPMYLQKIKLYTEDIKQKMDYEQKIREHIMSAGNLEDARAAALSLLDTCYVKYIPDAPDNNDITLKQHNEFKNKIIEKINNNFNIEGLDIKGFAARFASTMAEHVDLIMKNLKATVMAYYRDKTPPAGTFANVLANLMFGSGQAADDIIGQLMENKKDIMKHIWQLKSELKFSVNIFGGNVLESMVDSIKEDLKKGAGPNSYQVQHN